MAIAFAGNALPLPCFSTRVHHGERLEGSESVIVPRALLISNSEARLLTLRAGHRATSSSYFDRMWKEGAKNRRFFFYVSPVPDLE